PRGGRALRGRLEADARLALRIEPAERVHLLARQVLLEPRHDAAWMNGVGRDAGRAAATVEPDGEERVRGLRLPVGAPLVVRATLEMNVVELDGREAVADRAERDHPARCARGERGGEPAGEQQVAEVVARE